MYNKMDDREPFGRRETMNVSEAVRTKRAVRQFTPDPLPENVIKKILNAGRRAQSSKNTQRWRFIAITDRGKLEKLSKTGQYAGHLAGAALGVFILTPNPTENLSIMFDAGQAAAYMQLAAWELGVGSCIATIYETEQARKLLCFPDDWHSRMALSFGYPAEPDALTRSPKKGGRISLTDLVHWNAWESSPCDE
jgi:nitroreductase